MSLPTTVDAVAISKTGDFDVIEKATLPFPKVHPEDIVVKVEYFGVNFIDTYYRKGLYPIEKFPAVLGTESAGIIAALPTDETVLNDPDYKKRNYTIGSKVLVYGLGAHATYVSVPWTKAHAVPDSIGTNIAAACGVQALTALTFLTESYNVKQGDVILIHTVAGGLGLLMTQLAKHRGATVIGTTSTEEKAEFAKANGADHVILYPVEDTVERVLEITKGEGVHAVFDGVGKDTFDNNLKLLRRKGTLVSVGNASGAVPPKSPLVLTSGNFALLRPTMGNYIVTPEEKYHYTTGVFDLIAKGVFKINIFKEYPFTAESVRQAQKDLTGGKTIGKLLIKV
ncbi:NAD(P)-binding protein [Guyanagaster necrorhizus]|uniref:Probable quinone oxidoreductase n=1 Tax=Guyanagaster necrorhizus TaxID=856835 RepID=A0A9P7W400_9AGAR|nr:NAD(P)-binding protein [Guyanagaster necrorhizus MCA 3950]KAG7451752.1 NAD(P)-binding protein [Guyanagaster necrorhizus MCA 3950]